MHEAQRWRRQLGGGHSDRVEWNFVQGDRRPSTTSTRNRSSPHRRSPSPLEYDPTRTDACNEEVHNVLKNDMFKQFVLEINYVILSASSFILKLSIKRFVYCFTQ